jgi:hypothetical protein
MARTFLLDPGPWFFAALGFALVGGDYLNAGLLFELHSLNVIAPGALLTIITR